MLHGTIRKDDFERNTALVCWNNVVTIRKNIAAMCAKNRPCEPSRVTSPLVTTTTSCKNVETLRRKSGLSYFKSLLVTRL